MAELGEVPEVSVEPQGKHRQASVQPYRQHTRSRSLPATEPRSETVGTNCEPLQGRPLRFRVFSY